MNEAEQETAQNVTLTPNLPPTSIKCFAASPDRGAERRKKESSIIIVLVGTEARRLADTYLLCHSSHVELQSECLSSQWPYPLLQLCNRRHCIHRLKKR